MKFTHLLIFISFFFISWFLYPTPVDAQYCAGGLNCCRVTCERKCSNTGIACSLTSECGLGTCDRTCTETCAWDELCSHTSYYTCSTVAVRHECDGPGGVYQSVLCQAVSPPPTNPPSGGCGDGICGSGETCSNCPKDCGSCPGVPTSCTTGDCFTGINNCGDVGRDPGTGSCTGGLCCIPKSSFQFGCVWDQNEMGYPSCKFGEGNACDSVCQTYGSCSGCATGLVNSGGVCLCPGQCTVSASPSNISVQRGQSFTVTAYPTKTTASTWSNPPVRFSSNNTATATVNPAQDSSSPYTTTVSAVAAGSARIRTIAIVDPGGITCEAYTNVTVLNVPCILNLTPGTININFGDPNPVLNAAVTVNDGSSINIVNFYTDSGNIAYASNPGVALGGGNYQSTVTQVNGGSTTLTAIATLSSGATCRDTTPITITRSSCAQPSISLSSDTCIPSDTVPAATSWNWPSVPGANEYSIAIIKNSSTLPSSTRSADSLTCGDGTCNFEYSVATEGNYQIQVIARGTCTDSTAVIYPASARAINYCLYDIGGAGIIEDERGEAICSGNPSRCDKPLPYNPKLPGTGTLIRLWKNLTTWTDYLVSNPAVLPEIKATFGTYRAELIIGDPATWFCSAPSDCNYSVKVGPNDNTLKWFVASTRQAWFQVIGGDIHANIYQPTGNPLAIQTLVPFTCDSDPLGLCRPYPILRDDAGTPRSGGIISVASGRVEAQDADFLNQDQKNYTGATHITQPEERYAYLYRLYEFPASTTPDFFGTISNKPNPLTPANPGANGNLAYLAADHLTIGPSATPAWLVNSGETIVIFVPGNLTLTKPILVETGGFLAFIVGGDIVIDPGLGYDSTVGSTTATGGAKDLEGVFVADGTIRVASNGGNDRKFVGEGTFVAWSGFQFDRDFGSSLNNHNPVELFRFRPDFVVNAPHQFTRSSYLWQEIAP